MSLVDSACRGNECLNKKGNKYDSNDKNNNHSNSNSNNKKRWQIYGNPLEMHIR